MSKKKFTKKTEDTPVVASPKTGKTNWSETKTHPEKRIRKNIFYLIFIVSFMLYGNTIPNEYAMDDELVTFEHPIVSKGISGIPEIFTSRYVQNDQQSYEYRPIVLVTYAIEHQFTGGDVHFSHFINILLYALTGVLLFQLLSMLFIQFHWILPASITFLFLMHPIHSEVVASLKNRDELLSFIFTLLCIRSVLYYFDRQKILYLVYGILFFIIALLSKKSALPLIFTLPLILYFFRNVSLKKALLFFIVPVAVFFMINFLLRSSLEGVNRPGLYFENPYYVDKPGLIERIPMAFYSMGYYIKLLVYPYPLLVYYGYNYVDIAGWGNPLTLISVVIFLGGGIYALLNLNKKNILIFGFLYFTLNIGAFSNMVAMPGIIADRFAYGASLGFCIFICFLVFKLMKINTEKNATLKIPSYLTYGFLSIFLICNIYIFQRNKDWKDHLTIYLADIEKAPGSAKLNALIGGFCMQQMEKARTGKSDKKFTAAEVENYVKLSKKHFNAALDIFPDYVACLNNLGTLYYSYIGNQDSGFIYFEKVLKLDPHHVQANFNMGSYYENKYAAYGIMERILKENNSDSLTDTVIKADKRYNQYVNAVQNYYRVAGLAFSDVSKTLQQFIDDNRASNGQVNKSVYINNIDEYWSRLITKYGIDPSTSLKPGAEFIQAIMSTTITNPNEFSLMLQRMVQNKFLTQFQPLIFAEFNSIFNRDFTNEDVPPLLSVITKEKKAVLGKMVKCLYDCNTKEKMYPPAFQKLAQIYTENQLWDSLLHMNETALNYKETSRFTDIYRMMGTAYFYSAKQKKGIEYFEMSIAEEEKILRKTEISIRQQSAAGNSFAVQKLNQLIFNCRGNLYTLCMNLGAMHNSMGDENKANEYLLKSQNYKN